MANVKVSDDLFEKAKITSKVFHRSIAGQIEYWAKIGQLKPRPSVTVDSGYFSRERAN